MFRAACFFVSASSALGAVPVPAPSPGCLHHWNPFDKTPQTDLWCPGAHGVEPADGDEGYKCYKIPTLMRTGNGTLLAFIEARKEQCGDGGWIDIRLRRSFDDGATWTQSAMVYGEATTEKNVTIGDHSPVWDEVTQTVHLIFTRDNTDTLYTSSADHGATWAAPKDISTQVSGPHYFAGTGHAGGIQLPSGRLIIPMHGDRGTCHGVYSDDHGETWLQGGNAGDDECQFQQLANGTLIAVSRHTATKTGFNTIAYSHDDGLTWTEPVANKDLPSPIAGCETSFVAHANGKLYHSGPESHILRMHMVVKVSEDSGLTWQKFYSPWSGSAAYSSLALLGDRDDASAPVGLFYERNRGPMIVFEARGQTFTRFDVDQGSASEALTV